MIKSASILTLICVAFSSHAQGTLPDLSNRQLTISNLQEACSITVEDATTDTTAALQAGGCIGMVRGLLIVMGLNCARNLKNGGAPNPFAIRAEVSPDEAMAAFVTWAQKNPATSNLPAEAGMMRALVDAFPCSEPK